MVFKYPNKNFHDEPNLGGSPTFRVPPFLLNKVENSSLFISKTDRTHLSVSFLLKLPSSVLINKGRKKKVENNERKSVRMYLI